MKTNPDPMFPIIDISDWKVAGMPQLGYMEKLWIKEPSSGGLWLLKYPSAKYPLDAAYEKICAEIASLLSLEHQTVEFAMDDEGTLACICKSFLHNGKHLLHGGQLIGGALDVDTSSPSYEKHGMPFYTLQLILSVLDARFHKQFLESAVFDSLVANIDRHDKNWGIVINGSERLAPMYDYGLSFYPGKETGDTWFQNIAWEASDGTVVHNKLFFFMCMRYRDEIGEVMEKIAAPGFDASIQRLLGRIPAQARVDAAALGGFIMKRARKMLRIWGGAGNA